MAADKSIRFQARSQEEARAKAAATFGVDPSAVEIQVEGVRKSGLLGLGQPELMVLATVKTAPTPAADPAGSAAETPPAAVEQPAAEASLPEAALEAAPAPTRPRPARWQL